MHVAVSRAELSGHGGELKLTSATMPGNSSLSIVSKNIDSQLVL